MKWCWNNSIYIYPLPVDNSKGVFRPQCYIIVNYNGRLDRKEDIYIQNGKLYDIIKDIYIEIYNKNT